jgi:uncharacterized protein
MTNSNITTNHLNINRGNGMVPGQKGYKAKMLEMLMVVFALWATVAIAGVNEDLIKAAADGDLPAVKGFIAKGADVNAKDSNGATALIEAAYHDGDELLVQALLDKGADINAKMNNGSTALMCAAHRHNNEVVLLLLANGADVKAKNNNGTTALWFAVSSAGQRSDCNRDVVQAMLDKGADVNAKTNQGKTVLLLASQKGYKEIVELLINKGADINAITVTLPSTPPALRPLFDDPETSHFKGREVHVTGLVDYSTDEYPHKFSSDSSKQAYARLKTTDGEFDILLDSRGEQMANTTDGKSVEVRGILTGQSSQDLTASLSSGTIGTITRATRVLEIKVEEFKETQ